MTTMSTVIIGNTSQWTDALELSHTLLILISITWIELIASIHVIGVLSAINNIICCTSRLIYLSNVKKERERRKRSFSLLRVPLKLLNICNLFWLRRTHHKMRPTTWQEQRQDDTTFLYSIIVRGFYFEDHKTQPR